MPVVKLTKTVVEKLPHPERGQVYYFDEKLRGFGVSVARLSKTYFAQRDVNGKTVRSTIGKHGVFKRTAKRTYPSYRSVLQRPQGLR